MSAAESLKADPLKQVSSEGSNASSQLPVKDLEAPRPKSKDPGKPTSQSDPNQVKATDTPPPPMNAADALIKSTSASASDKSAAVLPTWYKRCCGAIPKAKEKTAGDHAGLERGTPAHAVLTKTSSLWPLGYTITYSFIEKTETDSKRFKAVQEVVTEWQKYANIKFAHKETGGKIRIAFDPTDGSWSYVGRDIETITDPNRPTMNLGWIDEDGLLSDNDRGVILHEFGHAIGLEHEHQSPARGGTINLDEAAVIAYYGQTQGWDEKEIREQIINVYNKGEVGNYSAFDRYSVMEYFMPAEMNLERIEIKPNNELSKTDKAYITATYPPANYRDDPTTSPLLHLALTAAGVPAPKIITIVDTYKSDPSGATARLEFSLWNETTRLGSKVTKPSEGVDPTKPPDGTNPTKPSDGTNPTKPSDETNPTKPSDGTNPTKPSEGAIPPKPSDGLEPPKQRAPKDTAKYPSPDPKDINESEKFLVTLYKNLKKFFSPGGGQIFCLQFPGRFLAQSQYAWDTKTAGIYGQFVKPTIVNESEFRLVDQMYDLAEIVSAPNGINLSIVYEQMLNNLIPKYQDTKLTAQQAKIRAWLLKDAKVSSWMLKIIQAQAKASNSSTSTGASNAAKPPAFDVSDKTQGGTQVNRLELSNALIQEYLEAKQKWELERDAMIEESLQYKLGTSESDEKLNALTRKLAHITAVREAQLASKYADAVVQGFYHNIRQYFGYLDIKSSAEFLQDAKDSFREAAMSSMDGALKVFPVQMMPIDWFEGLSTSFTVEDLTSNPALIQQVISAKSAELDTLNSHLVQLTLGTKGNPADLDAAVRAARDKLQKASSKLTNNYTMQVITLAKTAINIYGQLQEAELGTLMSSLGMKTDSKEFDDLKKGLVETSNAQQDLESASRALSDVLSQQAVAEATDTQQQQEQIKIRQASLKKELDELVSRYTALNTGTTAPAAVSTDPKNLPSLSDFPLMPKSNNTSGGSRWQEFSMWQRVESKTSNTATNSSASVAEWDLNLWVASGHGGTTTQTATNTSYVAESKQDVELGFRATMVTVDRSGWFQPQFFKQSEAYCHVNKKLKWINYPQGVTTPEELKSDAANFPSANRGLLPCYPVGYIICKDITIKISNSKTKSSDDSEYFKKQASSSGGALCFSFSSSSTETASSKSYSFQSCADGCVIRIPGPQILGYILQITDLDESGELTDIPDSFWIPEDDEPAPSNSVQHGLQAPKSQSVMEKGLLQKIDDVLKDFGVSDDVLKTVHVDLKKDLEAVLAETR